MQWVAGDLSGANMEVAEPEAVLGTDFDGLMAWIDNYCQANPINNVAQAAGALLQTCGHGLCKLGGDPPKLPREHRID
jgi:hypothetical protein